ncbi:hypothetical protein [Rickettsia tamurae]|uniref:Uncharacterized protein n=1 Tax=Rickettsia tamurae subsp. buchneri TaxID=1462938 RepID=A0A8E0WL30_9RICK|nr:hypothetical protein REISMN_06105 [Rickettsia tamurae subsp. buchneri]
MGIIHEIGHALYEQNLPEMYKGQSVELAKGLRKPIFIYGNASR